EPGDAASNGAVVAHAGRMPSTRDHRDDRHPRLNAGGTLSVAIAIGRVALCRYSALHFPRLRLRGLRSLPCGATETATQLRTFAAEHAPTAFEAGHDPRVHHPDVD